MMTKQQTQRLIAANRNGEITLPKEITIPRNSIAEICLSLAVNALEHADRVRAENGPAEEVQSYIKLAQEHVARAIAHSAGEHLPQPENCPMCRGLGHPCFDHQPKSKKTITTPKTHCDACQQPLLRNTYCCNVDCEEFDEEHAVAVECPLCGGSQYHAADCIGIEALKHDKDSDCTVDPATGYCTQCYVLHTQEPCPTCGGRAFHTAPCLGQSQQS